MISRSDITNEEFAFLVAQKIHWENLYDGRGRPPTSWDQDAKRLGLDFGLAEPCYRGHRLRDRKGHCIQCNTANIAYIRRSSAPGYVYIAVSKWGRLYKVGSTVDYKQRETNLRRERYAGCGDWKIICVCKVENSGKTEFNIHEKLSEHKVSQTYEKAGETIAASEVFRTDLTTVWQAYHVSVDWKSLPKKAKARVTNFAAYDLQG